MDGVTVLFLSTVINRLTEQFKVAFLNPLVQSERISEEQKAAITLFISLVLGVIGVLVFFPATNLFVGLGRGEWAEQIATGIVIGGLSNGIDFLATRIARPEVTASTATIELVGEAEVEAKVAA